MAAFLFWTGLIIYQAYNTIRGPGFRGSVSTLNRRNYYYSFVLLDVIPNLLSALRY